MRGVVGNALAARRKASKFLVNDLVVGEDAQVTGDLHRGLGDLARAQRGVFDKGQRGRLGVTAATANGDDARVRLDHIAHTGEHQCLVLVGDDKDGLQLSEEAIGAPELGQLHGGAREVVLMRGQLLLEAFKEGEGIGGRAGKTGDHLAAGQSPDLSRGLLHHDAVFERDLAIAGHADVSVLANTENGGALEHCLALLKMGWARKLTTEGWGARQARQRRRGVSQEALCVAARGNHPSSVRRRMGAKNGKEHLDIRSLFD